MEQAQKVLPELTYCADEYECAIGAEALVICTEWEQFRALDLDRLKTVMVGKPAIVDLRNVYQPEEVTARGISYLSVGRTPVCCPQVCTENLPLQVAQPKVLLAEITTRGHMGLHSAPGRNCESGRLQALGSGNPASPE
jgi:hypothetical protein